MLKIDKLTKIYGKTRAVDELSYSFGNGIYGLLGPNGAGKTTLINIVMGSTRKDSGTIFYQETPLEQNWEKFCSDVGFLPQNPVFYKDFQAFEFLEYMCVLKGLTDIDVKTEINKRLVEVNLADAARKKIGAYSGGMRQRLGIAQAMLGNPKILIFDEPTAGLDPIERIRFRNNISRLSEDKTIIIATHIVPDVESIAHQVVLMNNGKFILTGIPQELNKEIEGKVWSARVPLDEIDPYIQHCKISNIQQEENHYNIRIVSETQPSDLAYPTEPKLEEVYIYFTEVNV